MKKIPTLYVRGEDWLATSEVNPECAWVLAGEGVPTQKFDGTCVMLDENGEWWARREFQPGAAYPPDVQTVDFDPVTGKSTGWEPVYRSPFYRCLTEALEKDEAYWDDIVGKAKPGTFELCGPKINGNREGFERHVLMRHDTAVRVAELEEPGLREDTHPKVLVAWLAGRYRWEGVVWHHPDGRMAKLKMKDLAKPLPHAARRRTVVGA